MSRYSTPYMRATLRRYRVTVLQVLLALLVVTCFVLWESYRRHAAWPEPSGLKSNTRQVESVQKYSMREVDLDFIRAAGLVDHSIANLSDGEINAMNETELMVAVHSFLDNNDALCRRRLRMGPIGDGGWELCDDAGLRPRSPPPSRCLVYSFGFDTHFSFEDDVARVYACEVHAFRLNANGKDYNRSYLVHVHPYGVGRWSEITPGGVELYTFGDILTILGHARKGVDLIKMDIESGEWSALYGMLSDHSLDSLRQLLVEFHVGFPANEDRLRRTLRVLRGLSEAGFRKFYVHKNPKGFFHHPNFPVVRAKNYEIHYLNSKYLKK